MSSIGIGKAIRPVVGFIALSVTTLTASCPTSPNTQCANSIKVYLDFVSSTLPMSGVEIVVNDGGVGYYFENEFHGCIPADQPPDEPTCEELLGNNGVVFNYLEEKGITKDMLPEEIEIQVLEIPSEEQLYVNTYNLSWQDLYEDPDLPPCLRAVVSIML